MTNIPETKERFEKLVVLLEGEGLCVRPECGCESSALIRDIREKFNSLEKNNGKA